MRKIYETDDDRQRQNRIALHLADKWNCTYIRSPDLHFVDGKILNSLGQIAAFVEIKFRNNASNKYPTYMLSAAKWRKALELAGTKKVPFMLVVEFTDGIYATKVKDSYPIAKGGRVDRNDPKDIEDCIYIPMAEFKKV